MRNRHMKTVEIGRCGVAALVFSVAAAALAQQSAPAPQQATPAPQTAPPAGAAKPSPGQESEAGKSQGGNSQTGKSGTKITPEQAQQLFALVDELIKFSSDETGLPIKSTVKRTLTTRTAVESYLDEKFNEDEGAKRLERDEIVLKKFGLLDHDFELKPFLLALLKEQIEAYYDSKTKTVNILDWVDPDEQKPVMAHELTHALQDQHADLEKWDNQTPDDVSKDAAGDQDHLARDEMDTARDAVAEGQATAVMMDYILKPLGKSLVKDPEVLDVVRSQMNSTEDSPVMARAPLLLSESMLFPYREGLSFEQDIWMDQGQTAAFAGALDRPPSSSWEIINPRVYEQKKIPAIPLLPNIHPLVDAQYVPYDIGQIGELDVHIITELFGGDNASTRPDASLGRRPLLGGATSQRHHTGGAGQHQIHWPLLSFSLEERRLRTGISASSMRKTWAANTPMFNCRPPPISMLPLATAPSSRFIPPTRAPSSSPRAANWSSSRRASRCRSRASSRRSSSMPRAEARCA